DVKKAVHALQEGASHYILKPVSKEELLAVVNKSADELRRLRALRELRKQLDERFGFEGLIGNSPKMSELIKGLKQFAPTKATVGRFFSTRSATCRRPCKPNYCVCWRMAR